jgi:hypothetical protein
MAPPRAKRLEAFWVGLLRMLMSAWMVLVGATPPDLLRLKRLPQAVPSLELLPTALPPVELTQEARMLLRVLISVLEA